ncbi:hypothetical protein GF339_03050 [candidate division KSB3 bacterium]|uniref:Secreted protein n=1 Tax=candidate division KSB3 bacterium TaxID=2044937 RepID=A0A9D5Q4Q4_9BACT|nr:hypothetical protein [candidate division KSB3 bacterium]MBD3323533.1 hypothetical protein [candidate division KSB3 bacterium]
MRHLVICAVVITLLAAVGVVAQTQEQPIASEEKSAATPVATDPEVITAPRKYPIAAGVWYPGQPLPEKPFRYYRIRCWPGCHHNSEYGKYPDRPTTSPVHASEDMAPTDSP